jgi:hypothetical protein
MTLIPSPAAKQVQQAVNTGLKQLETKRVVWCGEHRKVLSAIAEVDAAPEGGLPAFVPVKDTLDRLQELAQLSVADLTAAGDPEPQTDLLKRLQSVAQWASKRTLLLAKHKAEKALVEPGFDLPTLLLSLIEPVGQTEEVWVWANGEMERMGQGSGADSRSFLKSIAARLVAGLLQAMSRLPSFPAKQDKALLAIQRATSAKQKKLAKKDRQPEQRTLGEQAAVEALAGSGDGTCSNTDTEPQTFVRKAKRARFDSTNKRQGQGKEAHKYCLGSEGATSSITSSLGCGLKDHQRGGAV